MSVPDDAESAAHFTRRFESFTDVVFGFSLSFLAGRLIIPDRPDDVFAHPVGIAGFLLSFTFLAFLWLLNHRMFRHYFQPTAVDMVLVFVELCGVALIPYALQIVLRFPEDPQAFVLYSVVYAAILGSSAAVGFRGFARTFRSWDAPTRLQRWRTPLIQGTVAAILFLAALLTIAGLPHTEFVYWLVPLAVTYLRRRTPLPAFARS